MKDGREVCGRGFTTAEILAHFLSSSLEPVRLCACSDATRSLVFGFTLYVARNLFLIFMLNFLARYIACFTLFLEINWLFFSNTHPLIYFGTLTANQSFFRLFIFLQALLSCVEVLRSCHSLISFLDPGDKNCIQLPQLSAFYNSSLSVRKTA